MTIGEKIRSARIGKQMTQSAVADDKITRNMISAIESDKALPSLDTLLHIAEKLGVPAAYFLSDEADISVYRKNTLIRDVREAFASKRYKDCISLVESIGAMDDELAYVMAYSNFELGVMMARHRSFMSAEKHLSLAEEYSSQTVYDTNAIECRISLYMSFVKNVNSPLLDFDMDSFYKAVDDTVDYEFFKYVCNDTEYRYKNVLLKKHMLAKAKMRERKYYEAISILLDIAESKASFGYNAYIMYSVYSDLDTSYKQVLDFENAYKYAEKRLSMIEGFNS